MVSSETTLRVLYAQTDVMGIMNNVRYFEFFEAGRNHLMRQMGYAYTELEKEGYGLSVVESYCKYISTAKYDDVVRIKAFMDEAPSVKVKIHYELFVEDRLISRGYTILGFINLKTLRPTRPPEKFVELVKSHLVKQ